MNLSWTSQTHCGVLAPWQRWKATHPECQDVSAQFWAVWGGKRHQMGPALPVVFRESTSTATLSCRERRGASSELGLWQLKADLPRHSPGLCLEPGVPEPGLACLGREGTAAPGCLHCWECQHWSQSDLLKGCQQAPQAGLERPKQRVLPKIMSERGIKKLL